MIISIYVNGKWWKQWKQGKKSRRHKISRLSNIKTAHLSHCAQSSRITLLQLMTVNDLPGGEWAGSGSSMGDSLFFSSLVREPVSMVVSRSGISSVMAVGESATGTWLLCSVHWFLWLLIRSRSFFSARLGAGLDGFTANTGKTDEFQEKYIKVITKDSQVLCVFGASFHLEQMFPAQFFGLLAQCYAVCLLFLVWLVHPVWRPALGPGCLETELAEAQVPAGPPGHL